MHSYKEIVHNSNINCLMTVYSASCLMNFK